MRYDIDIKGIDELRKALDPKLFDKAKRRTVRRMGQRFRANVSKEIRKDYNVNAKVIKKAISKGEFKDDTYRFYIKGRTINLIKFNARVLKKGGVSIKAIKKGGKRTKLRHAFIAKDKGGNLRIFERKGKERLPLRSVATLSVPQMFNKEVMARASRVVTDNFDKEFMHNYEWFAGKIK